MNGRKECLGLRENAREASNSPTPDQENDFKMIRQVFFKEKGKVPFTYDPKNFSIVASELPSVQTGDFLGKINEKDVRDYKTDKLSKFISTSFKPGRKVILDLLRPNMALDEQGRQDFWKKRRLFPAQVLCLINYGWFMITIRQLITNPLSTC